MGTGIRQQHARQKEGASTHNRLKGTGKTNKGKDNKGWGKNQKGWGKTGNFYNGKGKGVSAFDVWPRSGESGNDPWYNAMPTPQAPPWLQPPGLSSVGWDASASQNQLNNGWTGWGGEQGQSSQAGWSGGAQGEVYVSSG